MRKWLMLLFAVVCFGRAYSASHIYSLTSSCSVVFARAKLTEQFERVDIVATEDAQGRVLSPVEIVGYPDFGKVKRSYVIGDGAFSLNADSSANAESEVTRRDTIHEGFSIENHDFRISVDKVDAKLQVVVDDLAARRIDAEVESDAVHLMASDFVKLPSSPLADRGWPSTDDQRRYRSSNEEITIQREQKDGVWNVKGVLRFKGALYQKEGDFSIRFALCEEDMHGGIKTIAAGRVLGEMLEGEIRKNVVTYDTGAESVGVKLSLPKGTEPQPPHYERVVKDLERAGLKEIPVRLAISYGATEMKLDLQLQKEQSVRPDSR